MKSNYKRIGDYIREVKVRNKDLSVSSLMGINIDKYFMPSVANTIGTDMTKYKIVEKGQFACNRMHVGRDKRLPISLHKDNESIIVSPAYTVFEITDERMLNPEYLMMWFSRDEFDREAWFYTDSDVRGGLSLDDFFDIKIPVPSIDKQREIVKEYNTILNRIKLNDNMIKKLEYLSKSIYKQWFEEFEFINCYGDKYKSSGGKMKFSELGDIPEKWNIGKIGDYCKVKSGYAFKSNLWTNNGIPVIKIGSIQNNSLDINELAYINIDSINISQDYEVKSGDVLIAMTGATVGKIALVPQISDKMYINQRVGKFDLGNDPIKKAPFLFVTLLKDYVQNDILSVGGDSAQANISSDNIENLNIIMPPPEIINEYNEQCMPLFKKIMMCVKEKIILIKLKDILLQNLSKSMGDCNEV